MEGWRTGTGPRGLRMLGLHHVPGSRSSSALEAVRPIFPQAPPLACLGTSLFPGSPGRVPADRPGAPRWLPPLLARDPAILLPFAEKPPIYRSFSPRSFLLRRTPDFPAPKRSPTLARFQDPLLPSGDLPFTLSSPPGDPPFTHAHPSSDSHVFPPACLWPRSLGSRRGAGGWGGGSLPHFRHLVLGTPLTSAVRDVFTEESLLLSLVQQGRVFEQQE